MIIRPIFQTKHVNVEMTQPEVDALKALYAVVEETLAEWRRYVVETNPILTRLSEAQDNAPKIIEEGRK